jgi:hypothetical protein
MATRKQQRRKYQRAVAHARHHEGDAGLEHEDRNGRPDRKREARPRGAPLVPSAMRTAKRALLFATLFYLVITFTSSNVSPGIKLANTAVMFVLFWSMGWMIESFVWRRYQKKHGGPAA